MEVFLYNSTVCRLCGEENDSGTFLYSCEENNQNLSEVINTFLPIKVSDDGQLPRTICPGCTIQLEATVEFLNLIISGQKVIRELHLREKEYKKTVLKGSDADDAVTENIVYQINTNEGVYSVDHPTALQVSGLDRPKRKRGRPPKKAKSPEEVAQEAAAKEKEIAEKKVDKQSDIPGKRRRKTPTRFREAVQGKELDRIFKEEGVTDGEETDVEAERAPPREPEVIGHMETSGELVVVVKGKGRGRPKGRMRQTREQCAICGMEFSCVGRYMSHIAQHGPVMYQCGQCALTFATRLDFKHHQVETEHTGQNVIQCSGNEATGTAVVAEDTKEAIVPAVDDSLKPSVPLSMPSLRDISKSDDDQANEDFLASSVKNQNQAVENGDANDKENTMPASKKPIGAEGSDAEGAPTGKVKLKCPQCDKLFSSKQSKSLHIKAVHEGQKPYECGECGVRFAYPRSLALHVLAHRRHRQPDRRYACDLCGKVLNHPSSVVYHKQAAHAGQRYVCGKCGKPFRHRQLLRRHQLVHEHARPFQCKTCNASFKTKANLLNHQLLHSGVKKFSCEICKHKFAHKTSLTLHMRWHTGTKPYTCQVCGKSFSQKGNLSEHERIHTGEKPYACTLCPRRFTTSSQWRLHARRHQPDRPYPCHHCPKRFVSRGSWALHQMRAGLVPAPAAASHPCVECGRAFASRRALGRHARLHAGPRRPARCDICPRSFADVYSLNRHKRQVHKQVSLLATDLQPIAQVVEMETVEQMEGMEIEAKTEVETEAEVALEADAEDVALDSDERVIYVAYDVDDSGSAYHILDADEAASLPGGARRAFPALGEQLQRLAEPAEPIEAIDSIEDMEPLESQDDHMPVTDEQGNPLTLTMADGSRLAVTSADGRSLQVVTRDGTAIPVSIDAFQDEDEELEEESTETATIVHELDMDKVEHCGAGEPVTHYFTIV